jgi:hypothetical protein
MNLIFFKEPLEGEIFFLYYILFQMYLLTSSMNNGEVFETNRHKEMKREGKLFQPNIQLGDIDTMVIVINNN